MNSTGAQFNRGFDAGRLKQGVILGTEHCYLVDGVWVRCDCGSEILEVIQVDLENPEAFEYQFRCLADILCQKKNLGILAWF